MAVQSLTDIDCDKEEATTRTPPLVTDSVYYSKLKPLPIHLHQYDWNPRIHAASSKRSLVPLQADKTPGRTNHILNSPLYKIDKRYS